MTVSLKHNFVSSKTDGDDATQVQPSNWNEEHVLTLDSGNVLGRTTAGAGAVEEISLAALAAAAGYVTLAGTETLTNKTIDTASNTITIAAADVSDFDTEVSNNADVAANTAARHAAVTLAGTGTYLSLTGQEITVDPITESDISDLGTSIVLTSDIGSTVQAYDADLDAWATKTAPSGTVVGTSDTQTLTNKTITSAAFSGTQTGDFTTTGNITIDSAGNAVFVLSRGSVTDVSGIAFQEGDFTNWQIYNTPTNRNFDIYRYNSSGVFQDTAVSISGSTGNVTIANALTVSGTITSGYSLIQAGGNASTSISTGNGDFTAGFEFQKNGSRRWLIYKDASTESGSNVGSNLLITRYSDAAGFLEATFGIIRSNGYIFARGAYANTTASAANVFVDSSGYLQRSTSSLRYKINVEDMTYGLKDVLALRPVTYAPKPNGENEAELGTRYGGLIAEEVDAAGLKEFVGYNDEGQPDSLHYGHMVSLCIKAIQELKAEVDQLRKQINGSI